MPKRPFRIGARAELSGRWQVLQAFATKSCSPDAAAGGAPAAGSPASHASYARGSITTILPTIFECSTPQYWPQKRWNSPVFVALNQYVV